MRHDAKAPSTDRTPGIGTGRSPIGRAFAMRAVSHRIKGSSGPSHRRVRVSVIAAICVVVAIVATPIFVATAGAVVRAALSTFAEGRAGSAGGFSGLKGLAVNTTGAGGVPAGTVYANDEGGRRVQRFSANGVFERAWGMGVAAGSAAGTANLTSVSGTGTLTANSTSVASVTGSFVNGQTISGVGVPPGTTISSGGGTSTLTLSRAATRSGTGVALRAGEVTSVVATSKVFVAGQAISGSGIPAGTTVATVTSGVGAASKLTLSNAPAVTATGVSLTAGADSGNVASNEIELVTVPAAATGTYKLKFESISPTEAVETATISVSAPATGAGSVQEALEGAANLGVGNVAVSEVASRVYSVEFKGRYADTNVTQLTIGSQPTGGTVTVATQREGAIAYESCTESCVAGTAATIGEITRSSAGGLQESAGLTVDQSTGNVYVADNGNHRVDVYSAAGAFEGAFGWDVVNGGAAGTGTITTGSNQIASVVTTSKAFAVGQTITDSAGGIPANTKIVEVTTGVGAASMLTLSKGATSSQVGDTLTVTAGAGNVPGNGVQTVSFPSTDTGTYKLKFKTTMPSAEQETATIAVGAPATGAGSVQEALANLANVGTGNVAVTGPVSAGGTITYKVEFLGTRFADTKVEPLTVATQPTGSGLAIATVRSGGALEFCTATSGCQAGTVDAGAGAFSSLLQSTPAVDPTTGDLYVPDAGNVRINEFRPVLNGSNEVSGVSFVRAFGWDVAPGAVNGQQEIRVKATSGKFVLNLGTGGPGVSETAEISATATAGEVQTALNAITNVSAGGGSVAVSGGPGNAGATKPYVVSFNGGALAGANVAQLAAASAGGGNSLSGGTPSSRVSVRTLANGHAAIAGLEDCTAESGCQKGVANNTQNVVQFGSNTPGPIAVDFEGDIYSVSVPPTGGSNCGGGEGNCQVLKFSPEGEAVSRFGPGAGESENDQCRLTYTEGVNAVEVTKVAPFAVAIDPSPSHHDNHIFIARKTSAKTYRIYEYDPEGGASKGSGEKCSISPEKVDLAGESTLGGRGLAIGTEARIYANQSAGTTAKIYVLGPLPPASAQMVSATATGSSTAQFTGQVTPPAEVEGERVDTTWHFEYSTDQETWTKAPVTDKDAGSVPSVPVTVAEEATGLKPNTKYFARVCATTSSPVCSAVAKFTTQTQAPSVVATYPEAAAQTEVTLAAQVNPNSLPSSYHFEWATNAHWQEAHSYDHRTPGFERNLGSGGVTVTVQDTISGLQPASVYHFRVITQNTAGTTTGPDQELETIDTCGLPDNRCYELVSRPDKGPAGVVTTLYQTGGFKAAPDGGSVVYPYLNPAESSAGSGLMYLAKRSASGWSSTQLSPPALVSTSESSTGSEVAGRVWFTSPSLSCSIVSSYSPLNGEVPAVDTEFRLTNLFRRDGEGNWRLVTTPVPLNYTEASAINLLNVSGASPDCERVYFSSNYQYLPGSPSGLYESENGTVRDAGLLPDGSTPAGAHLSTITGTYLASATFDAISEDGVRLFFSANSDKSATSGKQAVFVRDGGASVEVSEKQGGAHDSLGSRFALASKDGSQIFFISTYGLTSASSTGPTEACNSFTAGETKACDAYSYDTENGHLTDLSADTNGADTKGAVVQQVLASSREGGLVYFTAMGQLIPGKGKTYAENTAPASTESRTVNVYLSEEGTLHYVATVGVGAVVAPTVTPDGRHMLFTSTENLTGNENGGAPEAYLYSTASGEIQCVSCRHDGKPASGVSGATTLSRPVVSEDGSRVFFISRDALAPSAVQGNLNVYEWKRGQVFLLVAGQGKETSTSTEQLYGATPSGNDVFFGTIAKLVPQDVDSVSDLYDARSGGGFAPPEAPPALCDPTTDQCQGPLSSPPVAINPASIATGPGNPLFQTETQQSEKQQTKKKQAKKTKKKTKKRGGKKQRSKAKGKRAQRPANNNRGGVK